MNRVPLFLGTITLAIVVSVKAAWCLEVSPDGQSGDPGGTVTIPVYLYDLPAEGFDLRAFGFIFNFDDDSLNFISTDRSETLTESFDFFSAELAGPGQVEVKGAIISSPVQVSEPGGILVKIVAEIPPMAFRNSKLALTDFIGDISNASTQDGVLVVLSSPSCIEGYVRDAVTDTGIGNAVVTIHRGSFSLDYETAADGSYIAGGPYGIWDVTVSAASYESVTRSDVSVFWNCSTEHFFLHPEGMNCVLCDSNQDGELTAQDGVDCFWLSFSSEWSDCELKMCDMNEDGEITAEDAVGCFWYVVAPPFPFE
jgi:hypothetical protein